MTKEELDKTYSLHAAHYGHIKLTLIPELELKAENHKDEMNTLKIKIADLLAKEKNKDGKV